MRPKDADTLFLRIFVLLLVAFIVSSFLAFAMFQATAPRPIWRQAQEMRSDVALPPQAAASTPVLVVGQPHPPWLSIGLDVVIKVTAGALAAWFAARALSTPMRRLSDAARGLGESLSPARGAGVAPTSLELDETRGTREVRETAQVFNSLSRQLRADFETQRLLLATVSHDLRTPLTRLRMRLAELEAHPAAQRAIDDVRQMDELIESLLALFRPSDAAAAPSSGSSPRIDAFALVQAIVDDLPADGPAVALTGEEAATRCPPAVLRRMVDNLLENAVRHGGPHNAIDVHVSAGRDCVCIRIADRGPGLSAAQLASAGTPFLRWVGDDEDGQRRAGLGLGLYITRALAERERGGLKLAARDGGGLVATLELPLAR